MGRLSGKFLFWGLIFVAAWYGMSGALQLKHGAFFAVLTTIGCAIFWSKVIGPWYGQGTEELRQKNRALRIERERAEAHALAAQFDEALTEARATNSRRMAFDLETQRANGMPMYHTHYISPEHQRYLEEFYVDDEGLPSLKAGVYVTPIPVTGPERIDAPPPEHPFFIPVKPASEWPTRPAGWTPSYCRFCGTALGTNDRFCGECGEQLDTRFF